MENKTEYPVSSRYMIPDTPLAYADSFKGVGVEGLLEFINDVDPWYKDFTARDMRDVAAYFYAPCSAEFLVHGKWVHSDDDCVAAGLIKGLCVFEVRNVKLKLRPMDKITRDEMRELFLMAIQSVYDYDWRGAEFEYEHFQVSGGGADFAAKHPSYAYRGIELWPDGSISVDSEEILPFGNITAYLQSIGIYVPGTIREQFVALQQ